MNNASRGRSCITTDPQKASVGMLGQCSAALCLELERLLARMIFCRMSRALLVHMKGWGEDAAAPSRGGDVAEKRSTMFSQEAEVGVKSMTKRGCLASHSCTTGCLCIAQLSAIRCKVLSLGVSRSIFFGNFSHSA